MGRELRAVVKWQDNSRDTSYEISEKTPGYEWANLHAERYQERVGKDYVAWEFMNRSNVQDENDFNSEPIEANPDQLSDEAEKPFGHSQGHAQPPGERILLDEVLATLTAKQREVWESVMVKEIGQKEVAEEMGINQQMVSQHLVAARKKVVAYLEANKSRIRASADE